LSSLVLLFVVSSGSRRASPLSGGDDDRCAAFELDGWRSTRPPLSPRLYRSDGEAHAAPRARGRYSLNAAIAFSPLFTVTLFDFVAPLAGLHVTA
jgi:hypothetical protein